MTEFHDIANLFPLMQGEEFDALKADIQANGLREPIWLHPDGRILDGRNRYRACLELGLEPRFKMWNGRGSLVSFIVSMNLHRRHLTSSQRAAIAVELLPLLEQEAARRVGGRPRKDEKPGEIFPQVSGKSADQAAALTGTNGRYVSAAKRIKRQAPTVFERVVDGTVTLPDAKKLTQLPEEVQAQVIQKITAGKARNVKEAHRQVKDERIAERMAHPAAIVKC